MFTQVLGTLTSLMAGNEASRCRVREDVGYQVLYCLVTRLLGAEGPSLQLLMQLLGLVLEVQAFLPKQGMEGREEFALPKPVSWTVMVQGRSRHLEMESQSVQCMEQGWKVFKRECAPEVYSK